MTAVDQSVLRALEPVTFNMYRDVHKGIRAELFAVTTAAGALDPADAAGRADLARHMGSTVDLLVAHAAHEDAVVQPAIEAHLPALAAQIAIDHPVLEARIEEIRYLAGNAVDAPAFARRSDVNRVYLELASFTSAYLAHQDLEEREVMPGLERAIGVDGVLELHQAIIASLTPEETAISLPLMIPAMNVDDRTEMLCGMQREAPPEAFAQVWGLVRSVLVPADRAELARRLGIDG